MSATINETKFDAWCILEIMGHQRYAGRVTEQAIGGASFLRLDVPATESTLAITKWFSAASVYAITPVSQEVATAIAKELAYTPVSIYDLPEELREKLRQPRITSSFDDECDEDDSSSFDEYES